ncbi:MAG TPA: hypothetical protein VGS28_00885 [Candidatus Saccharimonadales bacterium]|nr:hypothetical protein [Candidatus Saccharimonadales bacterium]
MPERKSKTNERDSAFFLKLILYVLAASFWLKFTNPLQIGAISISAIPVGFFIGLLFAMHEHFQIDRKLEYAILLIIAIVTFFNPAGIVI